MPIILIPLLLYVLYIGERKIFNRYWEKGLFAKLDFENEAVTEGETASLTEVITNRNFIPLHILQVNFQTDVGLDFTDTSNASVTDRVNVIDVFSLRFYEKITRKLTMKCKRRGFYSILQTSLVASDLFSSDIHYATREQRTSMYVYPKLMPEHMLRIPFRKLMGEIETKRFLYEDNFTFRGIRDYAPTDPMSDINWKASARTGELKVNLHDYTSSPEVMLVLNVEEPGILFETELIEDCIRYTLTLAVMLIKEGILVSLLTNGRDKVSGDVIRLKAGSSKEHIRNISRALSRIDLAGKECAGIYDVLQNETSNEGNHNFTYVYISTSRRDGAVKAAQEMADSEGKLLWLCPLTKSMEVNENFDRKIDFVKLIRE
ncbi:MAG: DUF58 domain-containing protein [Butyrivibrio sp.]|nr:DUF58 domain-containing protein [Butyrivibrio sp.]